MLLNTPTHAEFFIHQLSGALKKPLPGRDAQLSMAHVRRIEELERYQPQDDMVSAGVVLLLFPEHQDNTTLLKTALIARSINPHDVHSGQISFPGGRIEASDHSIEHGALRELEEEVGIFAHEVQVLGPLTPLYIPVSKFMVHPFVVYLPTIPVFQAQQSEVTQILTPNLGYFLDKSNVQYKDMTVGGGYHLKDVPYFDLDGRTLWGATAMILAEMKAVIDSI